MSATRSDRPVTIPQRRVAMLLAGMVIALVLVATRTVWLQSVRNRTLTHYAQGQQQNLQTLPAVRGNIVDRNGLPLAVGEDAVTFYATPKLLKDRAETALAISHALGMPRSREEQLVHDMTDASGGFMYVAREVSRGKAQQLEKLKLPGIGWYDEQKRAYPNGPVAGQIIGTVNVDNTGIEGTELLYDRSLTGQPGQQLAVRDPQGVPVNVLGIRPARDGRDVHLTIDSVIQQQAEQVLAQTVKRFNAQAATAIVLDPRTGEILAMAGVPRVDPGNWSAAQPEARRERAITDEYEPGSTFKVVTLSGALEDHLITPDTKVVVPPQLTFCADKKTCVVKDAENHGTEVLSARQVLVQSSNIGTIKIAEKLRSKRLMYWIKRFGFGQPTGIDFPGETVGSVTPLKDWSDVSIGNIPIGQGIAVTPIQLISAYAAIANDGVLVKPHLLQHISGEHDVPPPSRRVLSARTAATMRTMFGGVVKDEHGTGTAAKIPGYMVGGKTGTANVAENGVYVKGRYISSFVGFVPANNPRLVTLVVVNEPDVPWGGTVAAPAFQKISEFALQALAIPPDGES